MNSRPAPCPGPIICAPGNAPLGPCCGTNGLPGGGPPPGCCGGGGGRPRWSSSCCAAAKPISAIDKTAVQIAPIAKWPHRCCKPRAFPNRKISERYQIAPADGIGRACFPIAHGRYKRSGGWRWTSHSPTGSGPEGSSPNERGSGRSSASHPLFRSPATAPFTFGANAGELVLMQLERQNRATAGRLVHRFRFNLPPYAACFGGSPACNACGERSRGRAAPVVCC
jgi:hypothetical protein